MFVSSWTFLIGRTVGRNKALHYQESRKSGLSCLLTASARGVRRVGNSGGCGHFLQHGVSIRHFQRGCAVRSAPSAIGCDKFPASFHPPVTADDCVAVAVCYCGPSTHARTPATVFTRYSTPSFIACLGSLRFVNSLHLWFFRYSVLNLWGSPFRTPIVTGAVTQTRPVRHNPDSHVTMDIQWKISVV